METGITVLGGGSWGTVLANLASLNGNNVTLWMRDEANAESINLNQVNKKYLPAELVNEYENQDAKLLPPWDPMGALAQ